MNYRRLVAVLLFVWSQFVIGGPYAKEANDNPFLNGELNAKYEGEVTVLASEIIDLKPTKEDFPVYKLNLRINGVKNIWVTSITHAPEGGIKLGDMMVFKGFIASSNALDPDGDLEKITGSKTLLMAIQSQRAK